MPASSLFLNLYAITAGKIHSIACILITVSLLDRKFPGNFIFFQ